MKESHVIDAATEIGGEITDNNPTKIFYEKQSVKKILEAKFFFKTEYPCPLRGCSV